MEQPPNPLDNQDPLDDPMLDALERSIENPPGFVDPTRKYYLAVRSEDLVSAKKLLNSILTQAYDD